MKTQTYSHTHTHTHTHTSPVLTKRRKESQPLLFFPDSLFLEEPPVGNTYPIAGHVQLGVWVSVCELLSTRFPGSRLPVTCILVDGHNEHQIMTLLLVVDG